MPYTKLTLHQTDLALSPAIPGSFLFTFSSLSDATVDRMEEYDRGREQMHHHRVGLEVQVEAEYEQADQRENDQNESGTRVEVGEYGGQQENECGENEERVLTRRQYVELFDVEVNDEA